MSRRINRWLVPCALLGVLLLAVVVVLHQLPQTRWSASILDTLPTNANPAKQAFLTEQNRANQQLTIALKYSQPESEAAIAELLTYLNASDSPFSLTGETLLPELQSFYSNNAGLFATAADRASLRAVPADERLIQQAQQRLQSPAPLLRNVVVADPLLLTQLYFEQLPTNVAGFQSHQNDSNVLMKREGQTTWLLLFLQTEVDPFSQGPAAQARQSLEEQLQLLQQDTDIEVWRSGLLFHASAAANQAKFEISWFGGVSMLMVLILLIGVFRSVKQLVFTLLTLSAAGVVGLAAVLLVFAQPHVLACVFATTLIGVCIDYVFHGSVALGHGRSHLQRAIPALLLSGLTTILGYALLVWLPLPLLQQVGVFMAGGLLAALGMVCWLLPLLGEIKPPAKFWQAMCQRIALNYTNLTAKRPVVAILVGMVFMSVLVLLANLQTNDNVRALTDGDEALLEQEQVVQNLTGLRWESTVLLVTGSDAESVLQREEQLAEWLNEQQEQQQLQQWQGLSRYLHSQQSQLRIQTATEELLATTAGQAYLQWLGLPTAKETVRAVVPANAHPVAEDYLFAVSNGGEPSAQSGSVVRLAGLVDKPAFVAQLTEQNFAGVVMFDPLADATLTLTHYRQQLGWWLVGLLTTALLVLAWRLSWRAGLQVVAMVGTAVSLSLVIAALTAGLSLFHFIGAMLVVVLGLDYGIFCASRIVRSEALQAILLSALTTIVAFGALSFSSTPAIAAFGSTVLWGVLFCAFLSPMIEAPMIKTPITSTSQQPLKDLT